MKSFRTVSNSRRRLVLLASCLAWCAALLSSLPASAQPVAPALPATTADTTTTTTTTAAQPIPVEKSTTAPIRLSPFEVDASKDNGFAAASTYAGGRLATDLNDTAAPYSVVNQAMIQALGIHDLRDALDWTTDSFLGLDGSGGGYFFNIPVLNNTRGTNNTFKQRQTNFFPYFSPADSFDIERYDFGRGPNAVLFGLGGLGGQSMAMFKEARTDRPFQTLDITTGSYNQFRSSFDVNQPLNDQLAVRVDGLYANGDNWRNGDCQRARWEATARWPSSLSRTRKSGSARKKGQQDAEPPPS